MLLSRPRPPMGFDEFGRLSGFTLDEWLKSSSFPSDHGAFFGALAMGIFVANRRWGYFAFAWTILVVYLPRVYVGLHYPSDILAGLLLGGAILLLMRKPAALLIDLVLRLEKRQAPTFYAVAFFGLFEMARLFDEVRNLAGLMLRIARMALA